MLVGSTCLILPTQNFLALCGTDYYNGTIFHRNVAGYMVQCVSVASAPGYPQGHPTRSTRRRGGDPTGKGKGGHSIYGEEEPVEDEFSPHLKHDRRGVVSMINNGPNTNRSQFFITYARAPELDGKYTAIGRVIHGWETLDAMEQGACSVQCSPAGSLPPPPPSPHSPQCRSRASGVGPQPPSWWRAPPSMQTPSHRGLLSDGLP